MNQAGIASSRFVVFSALLAGLIGCQTPPQTDAGSAALLPSSSPWRTIVAGAGSEAERLALIDLRRYVAQVTGEVPALITLAAWQKTARPALIVGTPRSNPVLASLALGQHALRAAPFASSSSAFPSLSHSSRSPENRKAPNTFQARAVSRQEHSLRKAESLPVSGGSPQFASREVGHARGAPSPRVSPLNSARPPNIVAS